MKRLLVVVKSQVNEEVENVFLRRRFWAFSNATDRRLLFHAAELLHRGLDLLKKVESDLVIDAEVLRESNLISAISIAAFDRTAETAFESLLDLVIDDFKGNF